MSETNLEALRSGCANLRKHIENIRQYGLPLVVAINRFPTDTDEEIEVVREVCAELGVKAPVSDVVAREALEASSLQRLFSRCWSPNRLNCALYTTSQ